VTHPPDEELMLSFKNGDPLAFRELFDRYKNSIYGYVRRRVNDPGRAEEITLFKSVGASIEDLAAAIAVYEHHTPPKGPK